MPISGEGIGAVYSVYTHAYRDLLCAMMVWLPPQKRRLQSRYTYTNIRVTTCLAMRTPSRVAAPKLLSSQVKC